MSAGEIWAVLEDGTVDKFENSSEGYRYGADCFLDAADDDEAYYTDRYEGAIYIVHCQVASTKSDWLTRSGDTFKTALELTADEGRLFVICSHRSPGHMDVRRHKDCCPCSCNRTCARLPVAFGLPILNRKSNNRNLQRSPSSKSSNPATLQSVLLQARQWYPGPPSGGPVRKHSADKNSPAHSSEGAWTGEFICRGRFRTGPPEGGPATKAPRLQILDLGAIRVARQNMCLALGEALA